MADEKVYPDLNFQFWREWQIKQNILLEPIDSEMTE